MAIRSYHKRNKDQLCMYLPKKMVEKLGWENHDRLSVEVDERSIVLYKGIVLPTTLKKNNETVFVSLPIEPPKDAKGKVKIDLVDDAIVIKFL